MTKIGDIITALPVPDDVIKVRDRMRDVLKYRRKVGHWHSVEYGRCREDGCAGIAVGDFLPLTVLRVRKPKTSGPLVLTLPEVPKGAVALVGETGSRYVRDPLSKDRWRLEVAGNVPGLPVIEVFRVERSVTVEFAPPREPRTWTFAPEQIDALKALLTLVHRDELAESWWQLLPAEVREVLGDA